MNGRVLALLAAVVMASGCVKRTITVTSEPSGALVWLNDVQVGRTPVQTDFLHYGVYDVQLLLDGYEPVMTQKKNPTPWWDFVGPDLVTEALPINAESNPTWHFVMVAVPERSEDAAVKEGAEGAVIGRAREVRGVVGGDEEVKR